METHSVKSGEGKYSFEGIRENGRLLYEYVRGSMAYGLALPTSDIDKGAVFVMESDDINGLSENRVDQVNDERNDTVWYEIGKYVELLCKANPTMLESLFVDDEFVLYEHPAFKILRDNRQMFVTKETFNSFIGYAKSQIYKARGLNKKIVRQMRERLEPIDFCNCFDSNQGTMSVRDWLLNNGLLQKYCGLNHMDKMVEMYGIFYDFGTHIRCEYPTVKEWNEEMVLPSVETDFSYLLGESYPEAKQYMYRVLNEGEYFQLWEIVRPKGYHGIQREDGTSNEIRLDSIIKGDRPLNVLNYNRNGYQVHCREYKEYKEWEKMRNPQRYLENQGKQFDRKNTCHAMRLMKMGIEIAKTGQMNVNRANIDKDELLDIRLGNTTYDEIIARLESKQTEMEEAMANSTLPDTVDRNKVNELLIKIRKEFA